MGGLHLKWRDDPLLSNIIDGAIRVRSLGGLGYPLLSDMHRRACQAYGVHNPERNIARRSTFIVDREGILRFVEVYPQGATPDPEKLLDALRAIGGPTGPLPPG